MSSLALQLDGLERGEVSNSGQGTSPTGDAAPAGDYARRRPFMTRGPLRRERRLPPGAAPLVGPGDIVESGAAIARMFRSGRSTSVDLAGGLGIAAGDGDALTRTLVRHAGEDVAQGDILAERRAFGGLQRRTIKSPVTGRVAYVSSETGVAYIAPDTVPVELLAHLAGRVIRVTDELVEIEGAALAVAAHAGAGPAVAGTLIVATSPDALPRDVSGAIAACAFPIEQQTVQQLIDGGVAAIVATAVEDETLERLGWDTVFWPQGRSPRPPAPPVTLLALSFSATPPGGLWEALRSLAGRPASVIGREPGASPELLVSLGENAPSLYALPERPESDVTLAPGSRVRVITGRAQGLVGEILALSPGPYRLRSEVSADVADVAFPYGVRLRLPLLHLQAMP